MKINLIKTGSKPVKIYAIVMYIVKTTNPNKKYEKTYRNIYFSSSKVKPRLVLKK